MKLNLKVPSLVLSILVLVESNTLPSFTLAAVSDNSNASTTTTLFSQPTRRTTHFKYSSSNNWYFAVCKEALDPNGLRMFGLDAKVYLKLENVDSCYSIVQKDPFILYVSSSNSSNKKKYDLQYNPVSDTWSSSQSASRTGRNIRRTLGVDGSNIIIGCDQTSCFKLYTTNIFTEVEVVPTASTSGIPLAILEIKSHDAFVMGRSELSTNIVRKADLVSIKSLSLDWNSQVPLVVPYTNLNNLQEDELYLGKEDSSLHIFSLSGMTTAARLAFINLSNIGWMNEIMNLGSLQYLMIIKSLFPPATMIFIDKLNKSVAQTQVMTAYEMDRFSVDGFFHDAFKTRFYIGTTKSTQFNFETYYLDFISTAACIDPLCGNCSLLPSSCLTCKSGSSIDAADVCVPMAGKGFDSRSKTAKSCESMGCLNCTKDFRDCVSCPVNTVAKTVNSKGVCEAKEGFGFNVVQYDRCKDLYCASCSPDISTCTSCMDGTKYLGQSGLDSDNGPSFDCELMPGFGPDSSAFVHECSFPGCQSCFADFNVCNTCPLHTSKSGPSCKVDDGFGFKSDSQSYDKCQVKWCVECGNDWSSCNSCLEGETRSENGGCVVSDGFGPIQGNDDLLKCSASSCLKCPMDYTRCTQCDAEKGYELSSDKCVQKKDGMHMIHARFDFNTQTATVKFSQTLDRGLFEVAKLKFTLVNKIDNSRIEVVVDQHISVNIANDSLVISFINNPSIIEADLIIDQRDSSTQANLCIVPSICFVDYPIYVRRIKFESKGEVATKVAAQVINSVAITTVLTMMSSSPPIATMLFKFSSDLLLLCILAGPLLVYPSMILDKATTFRMIPYDFGSSFLQDYADRSDCQAYEVFARRGLECNVLQNYGEDLIVLFGCFLVNSAVTIGVCIYRFAYRAKKVAIRDQGARQNEQARYFPLEESKTRRVDRLEEGYGIRFVVNMLHGSKLELYCVMCIHMVSYKFDPEMVLGVLFCIGAVTLLSLIEYCRWQLINNIWTQVQLYRAENGDRIPGLEPNRGFFSSEKDQTRLFDVIHVSKMKYSYLSAMFQNLKFPKNKYELMIPVFENIRCVSLAVLVVGSARVGPLQAILALLVELSFLASHYKCNAKASRWEYLLDLAVSGMNSVYIILIFLASFLNSSPWVQQNLIGIIGASILILIALVNTVFVLVTLVSFIYVFIKNRKLKKNNNQVSNHSDSQQNINGRMCFI